MSNRNWTWLAAILASLMTAIGWAAELPRATPEQLGFSAERLDFIDRFYQKKIDKGEMAGIVLMVSRHGKICHFNALGWADIERKQPMQTDTIFRIYSMTKPIAATALMMLYQDGMFRLEDPISKYLPEFADLKVLRAPDSPLDDTVPLERPPTIEDLLRHTSGLGHADGKKPVDIAYSQAGLFDLDVSPAEFVHRLAKIPLIAQPGGKWIYSMGGDVEARLVEVLSGMPFDEFLEKRLFQPLGMKDTGFWLGPEKARRLATVYWSKDGKLTPLDEEHGNPQGHPVLEAWSVNSYTVNRPRKGGSYGLVADTEDYWRFAQMLLNRGELAGERVLAPRVVDYMTCDHLGAIPVAHPSGGGYGLGFGIVKDPATAGIMSSPGTYYWGGAASTCFWIDPKEDIVVVAMTQHMKTPSTDGLFPQLCTLVNSALIE